MARPKTYSRILTISHLERLNNSKFGNPRFRIFFTDGSVAELQRDSSYGYEIENPGHGRGTRSDGSEPNRPLMVEFTPAGQVAYARFATDLELVGSPEESAVLTKPLPDDSYYSAMRAGHANRKGHALIAHLESNDGGLWTVVRECCE